MLVNDMDLSKFKNCWFALQIRRNHEILAATILRNKGYEEFLPIVAGPGPNYNQRSRFASRLPFPGYVLCRFYPSAGGPIVTTPGGSRIVGDGVTPIAIAEAAIANIKLIIQSTLRLIRGLCVRPRARACLSRTTVRSGGDRN